MTFAPASMPWLAAHELRLMWRDGIAMMTGGHPTRRIVLIVILAIAAMLMHLMANQVFRAMAPKPEADIVIAEDWAHAERLIRAHLGIAGS